MTIYDTNDVAAPSVAEDPNRSTSLSADIQDQSHSASVGADPPAESDESSGSETEQQDGEEAKQDGCNNDSSVDNTEEENPFRMSLREEAASIKHKLNHKRALPNDCDACMRGKSRNARNCKGKSTRGPTKFGDIWTVWTTFG